MLDAEDILNGLVRGALGGRRKSSKRASRALRGGGLINAQTLLAAAGVAWGLYGPWQAQHGVRNPQAYLLRIAGHVIAEWRDHQLRSGLRTEVDEEELGDERTPEFELIASVSQQRLNETLAGVSAVMRAVLLLRLRDERTYRQIAEELDLTERQVQRYLARGYECLRRTLED